jgi:hypothetical protein
VKPNFGFRLSSAYPPATSKILGPITVSLGPWTAGQAWSTYPVPCNCNGYYCYSWCNVGSYPLAWASLSAENVCNPLTTVFQKWTKPLGYCTFPPGFNETALPPLPSNGTGYYGGSTPAGTIYTQPQEVGAFQALTIISTITVFFAAIAGCADGGMDDGNKSMGAVAAGCSFIAWVFVLAAYCLWTTFPYVVLLQAANPGVWLPIWASPSSNEVTAINVFDVYLGPGWATALTASILIIFANLVHCASLKDVADFGDEPQYNKPDMGIPPAAVPPAAAAPIPAGVAVPVPPASTTNIATV